MRHRCPILLGIAVVFALAVPAVSIDAAPIAAADDMPAKPALTATKQAAVGKLVAHLDDEDPVVRLKAVRSLGAMGRSAQSALPALRKRLKDADPEVRIHAKIAMEKIAEEPPSPAVQALIGELASPDKATRQAALEALGSLGPTAKAAMEPIRALTKDPDAPIWITALRTLAVLEAQVNSEKQAKPLRAQEIAGSYSGATLSDEAISTAIWKQQVPLPIPGTFKFEPQPAAPAREKVRQLFEQSRWTVTSEGDLSVQLNLPPGWERSYGQNRQIKLGGVLKQGTTVAATTQTERSALDFAMETRGSAIATQVWLQGHLSRDELGELHVEAALTMTGQNLLEAKLHQTLEPVPTKPGL